MSDNDMFQSQVKVIKEQKDCSDDTDVIPGTPNLEILKKKIRKKKTKAKIKPVLQQDKNFEHYIECTSRGSFNFNKPYVYHNIEEVLLYSPHRFPRNNNIHLIGVHRFSDLREHYLEKPEKVCTVDGRCCPLDVHVCLDFIVATGIPNKDEMVSVFGSVEFEKGIPKFFVKFYRKELEIIVTNYVRTLHTIRKYIPSTYLSVV